MQVANYGVGGQYEPHFDFGRVRAFQLTTIFAHFCQKTDEPDVEYLFSETER